MGRPGTSLQSGGPETRCEDPSPGCRLGALRGVPDPPPCGPWGPRPRPPRGRAPGLGRARASPPAAAGGAAVTARQAAGRPLRPSPGACAQDPRGPMLSDATRTRAHDRPRVRHARAWSSCSSRPPLPDRPGPGLSMPRGAASRVRRRLRGFCGKPTTRHLRPLCQTWLSVMGTFRRGVTCLFRGDGSS